VAVGRLLAGLFATIGSSPRSTSAYRSGVGQRVEVSLLAVAARRAGQPVGGFVGAGSVPG